MMDTTLSYVHRREAAGTTAQQQSTPLGRLRTAPSIPAAVWFLSSGQLDITGQSRMVDRRSLA